MNLIVKSILFGIGCLVLGVGVPTLACCIFLYAPPEITIGLIALVIIGVLSFVYYFSKKIEETF